MPLLLCSHYKQDYNVIISADTVDESTEVKIIKPKDQLYDAQLNMKLPNQTGTFLGSMILMSNHTKLKEVPMSISINSYFPLLPLVIVAAGAVVAFIVKFAKMRIDSKDAALQSLEKSEKAARDAGIGNRLDPTYFRQADSQFKRGICRLQLGDFEQAKKSFDTAEEYYREAKLVTTSSEAHQEQLLTDEIRADLADSARTYKGTILSLRKSYNSIFVLTTILLSIVVMQVWVQLYPQLQSFSRPGIEYISAFLLGYGSQSLLGEVMEFSRKR